MLYPYPADAKDAIGVLLGIIRGSGKLTDPADVHAMWVLAGFAAKKVYDDGSAAGAVPAAAVAMTRAELIPHLEAGLLGGPLNWLTILQAVLKLLSLFAGVA